MNYTVYKITNKTDGKIYVGVHQTKDLDDGYYGSGLVITRAIKKHGIENFDKEITHFCDSPEEMFSVEAEIVNEDFVSRKDTYNIKVGGFGGWDYVNSLGGQGERLNKSLSTRKRSAGGTKSITAYNREIEKKRTLNPKFDLDFRKQCGDAFRGNTHTEETKRKIGEANSKHQAGKGNSQYGTCWIYSLKEKRSMKIKVTQLDQYLIEGWLRGRKIKF